MKALTSHATENQLSPVDDVGAIDGLTMGGRDSNASFNLFSSFACLKLPLLVP